MSRDNWKFNDQDEEWINIDKYTKITMESTDDAYQIVAYKEYEDFDNGSILAVFDKEMEDIPEYNGFSQADRWMNDFMRQ